MTTRDPLYILHLVQHVPCLALSMLLPQAGKIKPLRFMELAGNSHAGKGNHHVTIMHFAASLKEQWLFIDQAQTALTLPNILDEEHAQGCSIRP